MSMSRDEMLADFQACTGVEEVDVAIAQLEQANWSLQIAVNAALATGPVEGGAAPAAGAVGNAPPQAAQNNLHRIKIVNFEIRYEDRTIRLSLPDDETVLDLKERLRRDTDVKIDDQDLSGFRSAGGPIYHVNNNQSLSALNLLETNNLRLRKNQPLQAQTTPTTDAVLPFDPQAGQDFALSVVVIGEDGNEMKTFELNYRPATTVLKIKKDVVDLTDIPVRYQKWVGWPESRHPDHELTLMKSGIPREHKLVLSPQLSDADTATQTSIETTKIEPKAKIEKERKPEDV